MKKLYALPVGRKNLLLSLALKLIEFDCQRAFYVVLNTVLAEKRSFTYRMFPKVLA